MIGVLMGTLGLILVAGLRTLPANSTSKKKGRSAWLGTGLFLASFAAAVALIGLIVPRSGLLPDTGVGSLVAYYDTALAEHSDGELLIIIDGGSQTSRGLDGELLSERLKAAGIPNTVVQMSLPGANVLERDFAHETLVQQLDRQTRERVRNGQTLFLIETYSQYSFEPLLKANENTKSARVMDYISLERALDVHERIGRLDGPRNRAAIRFTPREMLRDSTIPREEKVEEGWRELEFFLARTAVAHTLNIGILTRRKLPNEITPESGFDPIMAQREFELMPADDILNLFNNHQEWRKFAVSQMINHRANSLRRIWGTAEGEPVIFFATPSMMADDVNHVLDVCDALKEDQYCLTFNDPELMHALDGRDLWRDRIHLRRPGAELYTEWFADQLIAKLSELN